MTSEELAAEVAHVVSSAQQRILGVGKEQYSDGENQKFETMALPDLIEYAREEALDLVNYGVMLSIRLDRLQARVAKSGDTCHHIDHD